MSEVNSLVTQFKFILPRGLVDEAGAVHQEGMMRLATAKDELMVDKDPRSQESSTYRALLMFSRVIVRLGNLSEVMPVQLEGLFTKDLTYLREFYNRINQQGNALIGTQCPHCNGSFNVELSLSGEPLATP